MKIAHIITRMIIGGAQENTLLNCEDLLHLHGDDVLLITGPPLGREGSLLDRATANGVPLAIVPSLRRSIHPWHDTRAYWDIKQILRKYQPEVVHTHSAKGGMLGRVAAWSLRVPAVIHTVHGAPFHPYQGRGARTFFQTCERWAARRCHAMICVADAMTDLMVAANVAPRERFTTIYSGMEVGPFLAADEQRQRIRSEFGFSDQHVVVGKIARLFHLKGHDDLIAAAQQVVAAQPQVRFLLVGDGLLREALQQQIAAAGLMEHFKFSGLVPPARVPELIGAMDIVAHTSLREGLARVLPQALLAGKPAVSYDIDGAREVVVSGQTGFLLLPRDIAGLSAALVELAGNADLRRQFGAEGRRRCEQVFRHEFMTQRIRELYERTLAQVGRKVKRTK